MAKDTEEGAFDAPQFIEEFCQGNLRAEINKAVKELVALVHKDCRTRGEDHISKGEVGIKLRFSGKLEGSAVVSVDVSYEVTRKDPKPRNGSELFFINRKSTLTKTAEQTDFLGELESASPRN